MQSETSPRVCPVERANQLEGVLRRLVQNPHKIVGPYLKGGMTALDMGCGPGFFTLAMAEKVGPDGLVIAVDIQDGMLEKLRQKIHSAGLEKTIRLVHGQVEDVLFGQPADFALAFYMMHEVPDQEAFLRQIRLLLKPEAKLLIVEPPFHVSAKAFEGTLALAESVGFLLLSRPAIWFSKAALLVKV